MTRTVAAASAVVDSASFDFHAYVIERHKLAMRTFLVRLSTGKAHTILAHSHSNDNPQGHLNFVTISIRGDRLITDSFHYGTFTSCHEIPNPKAKFVDRRIQQLDDAYRQAVARQEITDHDASPIQLVQQLH